jgi:hypothetical protein
MSLISKKISKILIILTLLKKKIQFFPTTIRLKNSFRDDKDKWRMSLEASLSECLIGRWYYFVFKQKQQTNSKETMAISIRLADAFECNDDDGEHFMSIYDYLKLHRNNSVSSLFSCSSKQKLNYSNSSFSLEIDASSIVDETLNENEVDCDLLLDLGKLKL